MKVLIVDDEKQLVQALVAILKQNQIDAEYAFNGEDGLDKALTNIFDVVVLDIMMPKLNGYQVTEKMRKAGINTPILLLSAKSDVTDKIDGLNFGADDYLTKPFNTEELLARIRALGRRQTVFVGEELKFGDVVLNCNDHKLCCKSNSIALSGKEYQIMEALIKNNNIITPKEFLIEKIWGYDTNAEYNATEVYISFLRKKLNLLDSHTNIKSVRSTGYRLENEDD